MTTGSALDDLQRAGTALAQRFRSLPALDCEPWEHGWLGLPGTLQPSDAALVADFEAALARCREPQLSRPPRELPVFAWMPAVIVPQDRFADWRATLEAAVRSAILGTGEGSDGPTPPP
jgi:hypothetical protein